MKFFKDKKGFTLVELVVVIAILGILAGIAIPRFMDATASARGAKIVADMRTLDSAAMMYQAKTGLIAATDTLYSDTNKEYLAAWPVPPQGIAKIVATDKSEVEIEIKTGESYAVTNGRATLVTADTDGKDKTVDEILNK